MADADDPEAGKYAAMAKPICSEAAVAATQLAVQVFGGDGYEQGSAVERLARDARVTTIYEGVALLNRRISRKLVVAVAVAVAVAGCGGNGSSESTLDVSAGFDAAGLARAQQGVEVAYLGESFKMPAVDSPKAVPGKNIWVIVFALGIPETETYAKAAREAGDALGWRVTVFDGKGSPDTYLAGIRNAITAKADGIILYGVDCASVTSGLKQAKAAGVKIVGSEAFDCDDLEKGAPSYFDGTTRYTQGDVTRWMQYIGEVQADAIIAKTNGKADVIDLYETDLHLTRLNHAGFLSQMKKNCPDCKIHTVEFTALDFGKLQQKVEQALLQYPDANAMVAPYDGVFVAGAAAAVRGSGRKDTIFAVAGVGEAPAIELIRSNGGLDAGYGVPLGWETYDSMDILNRIFSGAKFGNSGIGLGFYDKEQGLPPAGQAWTSPIDYKKAYEDKWRQP